MTPPTHPAPFPESRLHFGVDETPGFSEPARQGGDELLQEPPQGIGRAGIGGDDSIHPPGTHGPGMGILSKARSTGLPMEQAQELISELVYPPLESDGN